MTCDMDNSDWELPTNVLVEHKWIRILAAVKSLHECVVESCKAEPTVAVKETTESAECSLLQWMEHLLRYSRGLIIAQDDFPPCSCI
jgi:hypothetical protein